MKRFQICLLIVLCMILAAGCVSPQEEKPAQATPYETSAPEIKEDEITLAYTPEPEGISETSEATVPQHTPEPAAETPSAAALETPPSNTQQPEDPSRRYAARDGIYTIAWISDPQHYSEKFPDTYYAMTSFLRDHSGEMRLSYIVNTGDLVNHPDAETEWSVADKAQAMIEDIPNGVLAGNHDVLDPIGYKAFCEHFGEKRYQNKPWYGGSFENNRGHYDLLTIGGTDYLFVYMGFAPTKKAMDWVYDVFQKYPDRIGVLCLHDYYTKKLTLSEDGEKWHDKVVAKSPNLYMVMCGHKYGSYCFPETFDDDKDGKPDRTVYQMLFNYQASLHDGGGGYLRLIQIDEAAGTMYHLTYSPVFLDFNRFDDPENREEYYPYDEKNEEFVLPLPWRIEY